LDVNSIDKDVLAGYNAGIEKNRLHEGLGLLEFERTKEILLEFLPPAPAVVYDIGGGYGEYSYYLTALGYDVYLYDLSDKNIEMSRELSREYGLTLKSAEVADARSIDRPDAPPTRYSYSGRCIILLILTKGSCVSRSAAAC
jgi:SAM-dependent methyltransferase